MHKVQTEASKVLREMISKVGGLYCILLGCKYNVGPWIRRGIYLLIQQKEPLDLKALKNGGLNSDTICLIYSFRDRAIVETEVETKVEAPRAKNRIGTGFSTSDGTCWKKVMHLQRDESEFCRGVAEIFASEYATYDGLGKESLDPNWDWRKSSA